MVVAGLTRLHPGYRACPEAKRREAGDDSFCKVL